MNKENTLRQIIAKRIETLQEQQGLTQEKLAYQSGISKGCVSGILNAYKLPTIDTVVKICAGLNMDIDEFFNFPQIKEYKDLL